MDPGDLISKLDINFKDPSSDTHSIPIKSTTSVVQQSPSNKNCVNIGDLPSELILAIFEPLYPTFASVDSLRLYDPFCGYRKQTAISSLVKQITVHKQAVKDYVDLRLICSRLNQVLTPIAFREMVVCISGSTRLERVATAFERGADLVRRLIIFGEPLDRRRSSYADAAQTIGDGLGLCSQLESLECYGNHHVFPYRRWLGNMALNLRSTVTSLVFSPNLDATGMDLSYALVGLGAHLRTLEISAWQLYTIGSPFHLPSEMPQLTDLTLRGGSADMKDVQKLITRATRQKAPNASGTLRSLSILGLSRVKVADMMAILSINNLCFQLTVLHWRPSFDIRDSLIPIVKACSNLVDFSYTHTTQRDILDHLPPRLKYLELHAFSLSRDTMPPTYVSLNSDFVSFLKSGRCPVLHRLTVLEPRFHYVSQGLDESLSSACDDVGVTLSSRILEEFEEIRKYW
jgi:hypothetical protein